MPQSLAPIPADLAIVEMEGDAKGSITEFFRLRWQQLMDGFQIAPTKANEPYLGRTAAVATSVVLTTLQSGRYRVGIYLRKTVADGASSSLQATLGWTDSATPLTETFAALTVDTASAKASHLYEMNVDANTDITIAIAYASTTPGAMTYDAYVSVELLA